MNYVKGSGGEIIMDNWVSDESSYKKQSIQDNGKQVFIFLKLDAS